MFHFFTIYTLWIYPPTRELTLTSLKLQKEGIHCERASDFQLVIQESSWFPTSASGSC